MDYRILYCFPFFLSAALNFIVAVFTLGRVNVRGGWYLAGVCLASTAWALSEGMLYFGLDIGTNMLITRFQYLGIASVPPLVLLFVLSVFGFDSWINRKTHMLFFLTAAAIVLLVWTNPLHKLFFVDYYAIPSGPFMMLGLKHGPLWWAVLLYHYALVAVITVILLRQTVTSSGYHRSQAAVILVAVAFVWLCNAVYVSGYSPVANMDISSIGFVGVAGAMAWGFFRYGLLDILPVAKAAIFRGLDDLILVVDGKDRILDINPAAESVFKVKASLIAGQEALTALRLYPQFHHVFDRLESSEISLMQDGQEHVYDLRVSFLTDRDGLKIGKVIALREITDRKKAEDALWAREKRLSEQNRVIMELSKIKVDEIDDLATALKRITETAAPTLNVERVGVWLYNHDHSKINCIELYEFSKKMHSAGMKLSLADCPHYFMTLREERTIAAHDARSDPRTREFADSYLKPLGITSRLDSPIRIRGQAVGVICNEHSGPMRHWTLDEQTFAASIADLISLTIEAFERKRTEAEKKKLEKQLLRAEKMEAIGTLAGGVAHDLNNILAGLINYPELLLMGMPQDSPLRKPLLAIKNSGERACAIVQDLLTLARRGVCVSEVLNLNDVIQEYLSSPQYEKLLSYHPNVKVASDLDSTLLNILGSPVHLSKTIMNLVANAAEAMPDGGHIQLKTKNKYIDLPIQGYDHVAEGDYALLIVSDTGIGIAPDEINKIFEPFYTKKVMGRSGTGLGMAVVWGTIKDHRGYIHVESDQGRGTTIEVYLPVTRKLIQSNAIPVAIENYKGGGQTVLVVDDVEEQREIAAKILTLLGYAVETVSGGEEACKYLASKPADLIVLDMIMDPGIDGLETYKRIVSQNPQQRAVIASGFSETQRVREAQRLGAGSYVKKPYTIEKIGLAVHTELNRSAVPPKRLRLAGNRTGGGTISV